MLEASTRPRPRGFEPSEISTLVNRPVVQIHAGEAAFLWTQRQQAVQAPHYQLEHLAKLDERVEAHLQALRLAGSVGERVVQAQLAQGEAGGVFVAAWLAMGASEQQAMRHVLALGLGDPAFEPALLAALLWLDADASGHALRGSQNGHPQHRRLALAVAAGHRRDPAAGLVRALQDPDDAVRAQALRAAGELVRHDLMDTLRAHREESHPECRFWANWSLTLLGDSDGPMALADAVSKLPQRAGLAVDVGVRCAHPALAKEWIRDLAQTADTLRLAIRAVGAHGDPRTVDWLIERMDDPLLARVAGEAFSTITGADLRYLDLNRDAPAETATEAPAQSAEDDNLPWPDREAIARWWAQGRSRMPSVGRCLGGAAVSLESAARLLRDGFQRQRRAAAIEAVRLGAKTLFPVEQRASRQQRLLAA
jgi:uncharacterized protein (TIGR02270 family)